MAHILRKKLPSSIQERWEQYKATHQKKLKEDVEESPTEVEEKPTPIMTPDETGISLILSNLIKDEWEAIDGYNSAIQTLADLKKDDAITILQDIVKEENVHVGQLEQLLKTFSVDAHDIDKGEQEAEEQLSK